MPKIIVFAKRPYYPEVVAICDTEEEARAAENQFVHDNSSTDGAHEATIYVAQLLSQFTFKTDY